MKTEDEIMKDEEVAYIEAIKDYLRPILKAYNYWIEDGAFGEDDISEEWMIEENVNHFLETYKDIT